MTARAYAAEAPARAGNTLERLNQALAAAQGELASKDTRIQELEQQNLSLHQRVAALELSPAADPLAAERLHDLEKHRDELNSELLVARARAQEYEKQLGELREQLRAQDLQAGERPGGLRDL